MEMGLKGFCMRAIDIFELELNTNSFHWIIVYKTYFAKKAAINYCIHALFCFISLDAFIYHKQFFVNVLVVHWKVSVTTRNASITILHKFHGELYCVEYVLLFYICKTLVFGYFETILQLEYEIYVVVTMKKLPS